MSRIRIAAANFMMIAVLAVLAGIVFVGFSFGKFLEVMACLVSILTAARVIWLRRRHRARMDNDTIVSMTAFAISAVVSTFIVMMGFTIFIIVLIIMIPYTHMSMEWESFSFAMSSLVSGVALRFMAPILWNFRSTPK